LAGGMKVREWHSKDIATDQSTWRYDVRTKRDKNFHVMLDRQNREEAVRMIREQMQRAGMTDEDCIDIPRQRFMDVFTPRK